LLDLAAWREEMPGRQWRATLKKAAGDAESLDAILRNTYTGRPLGTDPFLSKVEYLLGRRIWPLPVGRQKGWRKKSGNKSKRKSIKRDK